MRSYLGRTQIKKLYIMKNLYLMGRALPLSWLRNGYGSWNWMMSANMSCNRKLSYNRYFNLNANRNLSGNWNRNRLWNLRCYSTENQKKMEKLLNTPPMRQTPPPELFVFLEKLLNSQFLMYCFCYIVVSLICAFIVTVFTVNYLIRNNIP